MATLLIGFCRAFVMARTPARAAIAGLWLGLAALARAMVLPLIAGVALVFVVRRQPHAAAAVAITALAMFAPYAIRNYPHTGALLPTRTGINLFVSNSEYTDALVPEYHADWLEPYALEKLAAKGVHTASFVPVLILSVAGVWLRRQNVDRDAVLWCVLLTFVAVHSIFFPATRYRTPVAFVLLFYAAVALDVLVSRSMRERAPLPEPVA